MVSPPPYSKGNRLRVGFEDGLTETHDLKLSNHFSCHLIWNTSFWPQYFLLASKSRSWSTQGDRPWPCIHSFPKALSKYQQQRLIINTEHDRSSVAYCNLAWIFPVNQLQVKNNSTAFWEFKYSFTLSLKKLRELAMVVIKELLNAY